jgi:CheY-like chemotaxis protein
VDHRADIYSLGCTLHFLLTGRSPYQASSIMAMLLKHRDAPIPNLRAARPDVPPELETIFERMIAKAPDDRYQTMSVVVQALEQVQRIIHPVNARNEPRSTRLLGEAVPLGKTVEFDPAANAGALGETGSFEIAPAATPGPMPSLAVGTSGLTAILVEASRTQAGIIRRYLQQIGIDAVHATGSGHEALELAKRERAGVIVSAMHLSDMTGVQLAHAMLADRACDGIGFVLATSEADAHEHGAIPDSPRVTLMPKPFDPQRLAQSITAVVG